MLVQLVFILLPVVLSATRATRLCEGDECDARYARIAGGDMTETNDRPFQVALYMRVGTTGELGFCGGSLVHQEWVLTAAHCCFHNGREVDHVQAILGAHSLYDRYENGRRIVNVGEVVVHPEYDPDSFANDLALLRLANVIQLTETIDTVRLPYLSIVSYNFAGQGATASGWGIAANGVTFVSPTLREKVMSVLTDPLCNNSYFNQLPTNTVCGFASGAGTCKGDNGGPLTIWFNSTEETILIGVASFVSSGGCNDELPSVFTRTQRYLNWISDVTGIVINDLLVTVLGFIIRILVLLVVGLVASASARLGNYHDSVGIPLAKQIQSVENVIFRGSRLDSDRIVGGVIAPVNSYPYLAGLVVHLTHTNTPSACGSSLLSANRLVTAAHCWADGRRQAWRFDVVLGSQFLFQGGTRIATSSVVMHPQWTPSLFWNDVAMIYLPMNVAFNFLIQPIALPSSLDMFETFAGQWAVAAGYGKTSDAQVGVSTGTVVSHVNVQVITVEVCARSYNTVERPYVQQTNICTSGLGGVGICGGDSGGPLIINRNGQLTLVGISSFTAENACQGGHPSAFARVTSFMNFIRQHMW